MTPIADDPARATPAPAPAFTPEGRGWVVSPAYDLLLLANLAWPLLLLPGISTRSDTAVDFWQVYFLTLPHRWATLVLVALDPDRRGGRGVGLALIAAVALALVVGVRLGTGAMTCLAVVDYLWNAWHFGAQHAGVLRIYSRKVGGGSEALERHGVQLFVAYAALRTAGWATGWLEADPGSMGWLRRVDLAVLGVPALLVGSALVGFRRERTGRLAYLVSFCSLYSGLILAVSWQRPRLVVALATASGLYHAVEYLAVVTHYARGRRESGGTGPFRAVARGWPLYLGAFAVLLGSAGAWLDRGGAAAVEFWQGANLWAAMVHYAFDGMIWKLRRPETARAFGLGAGAMAGPGVGRGA